MGTTAITLPALTLTLTLLTLLGPGQFPCLSHSHVSLRVALRHGDHSYYLTSTNPYLDPPNPILGPGRFPCLSHSNVSLMPMSLSCLCLSHSYVSPIPLSISFPCLSYSPVSLIPMSLSILCLFHSYVPFPCLSQSHVSIKQSTVLSNISPWFDG